MKQVIFFCLLSVTLCLSKPSEPLAAAPHEAVKPLTTGEKATELAPPAPSPAPVETQSAPKETATEKSTSPPSAAPPQPSSNAHEEATPKPTKPTETKITPEKKEEAPKGNEVKKDETTAVPKETATETKPATKNEVKPEEGKEAKNETSAAPANKTTDAAKPIDTPKAPSSVAPKTDDDDTKHVVQARGFDGPSFIGGIILTLGLLAIGFMGFKYYKNQTERNYHTL